MAVASPPNSALPAEVEWQRIELGPDDLRHRSMPGAHPGDPSRGARLTATAAPNSALQPPAQPNDPKSSARRAAQSGQRSKGCDAPLLYLRRVGCAATLPIEVVPPPPSHLARAPRAQHQGYTIGLPLSHISEETPSATQST